MRRASNDWLGGEHTIALGYHQNEYQLENPVYDAGDWRGARGALVQDVFGETRLKAVYLQDVWSFDDALVADVGRTLRGLVRVQRGAARGRRMQSPMRIAR